MFRTAALIVLASASCAAFSDAVDWVSAAKHTYIVLPPQSITDGSVKTASYSSDGAYLLVGERPIIPDQDRALEIGKIDQAGARAGSLSLLVWDRLHRQIKSDWTTEDPSVQIDNVHWIHGTPTALIVMRSTIHTGPVNAPSTVWGVMSLNAATGKFAWVTGIESLGVQPKVFASPSKSTAMVAFDSSVEAQNSPPGGAPGTIFSPTASRTITIRLTQELGQYIYLNTGPLLKANQFFDLNGSGSVTRRVQAQPPIEQNLVWNSDGSAWLFSSGASKENPGGLSRLNDDGSLQPVTDTAFKSIETPQDLATTSEVQVAKHGKTQVNFSNLWLIASSAADHGELLLTPSGQSPTISPVTDSVYFVEGGVAKVRLILALPPDVGQALRDAEKLRAQANSQEQTIRLSGNNVINIGGLKFVITGTSAPPDKP